MKNDVRNDVRSDMKCRLDVKLLQDGLYTSREKARKNIQAGNVAVNGELIYQASYKVDDTDKIEALGNVDKFISRGGLKLEKALDFFQIDLQGKDVLDIGASTGGFTQCMLERGARNVIAIDVGHGQMAQEIRDDARVTNMEKTNIRYVTSEMLAYRGDFAAVDVSFISLKMVIPVVKMLLAAHGEMVCLVKPQFEAGKQALGKHGVVKDEKVRAAVVEELTAFVEACEMSVAGVVESPITGGDGNVEFLMYVLKRG